MITLYIPRKTLESLDYLTNDQHYFPNRSEAIRLAIFFLLDKYSMIPLDPVKFTLLSIIKKLNEFLNSNEKFNPSQKYPGTLLNYVLNQINKLKESGIINESKLKGQD